MSNAPEGLQFPLDPASQRASTSCTGKQILSEALALVDNKLSQQVLKEKNWRKRYPIYFKALVHHGILYQDNPVKIASQGLHKAHQLFEFYRDHQRFSLKDFMRVPHIQNLHSVVVQGQSQQAPEWFVPYQGQKLNGQALLDQIARWEQQGIIESSHAEALRAVQAHPEWFDLSDSTMVLFGAGSEAGPLTWLSKWKANIVAVDLPNEKVWSRILNTIQHGNAKLIAPCQEAIVEDTPLDVLSSKLGANLLTQTPEIAAWLAQMPERLNLAAIAYLDGEKHVRVAMAMDAIMQYISEQKPNTSLMFMCTPTDVYAVPKQVVDHCKQKSRERSTIEKLLAKGVSSLSIRHFLKPHSRQLIHSNNGKDYAIADCLVIEQGPNYALAKRIQQWRAITAQEHGQHVCINIAPSTTTHSVTKNPLLKAAFNGAHLFNVEAFEPETTNALMAAMWIHDLRNPKALANPSNQLDHPLELIMQGANHGGMWNAAYLVRSALPFAAIYGLVADKLPRNKK
ncbi:hypothetical protein [Acinetobacter brisouii]|uniref:hypothetical protein n=1 Tax=Acinetobacter brisouii TaxID=396323 RepID=UPI001250758E|nr:hypothetical protein [Acinetobacter brisouii]